MSERIMPVKLVPLTVAELPAFTPSTSSSFLGFVVETDSLIEVVEAPITDGSDLFLLLVIIILTFAAELGAILDFGIVGCETFAVESNGLVGGALGVVLGRGSFTCCFFGGLPLGRWQLLYVDFGVVGGLLCIWRVGGRGFLAGAPLLAFSFLLIAVYYNGY